MRATLPTTHRLHAPRRAGDITSVAPPGASRSSVTRLPLGLLVACTVFSLAGAARADARGACVETSAASAPTAAPLALDDERAAWVGGAWLLAAQERERGGSPAWCELGDDPQCDPASPAPSQSESVASSGVALAHSASLASALTDREPRVQHPPIEVAGEAEGQARPLERPPRLV